MSDIRTRAKEFLTKAHQEMPTIMYSSKLYQPNESWTKDFAWWFNLPTKIVDRDSNSEIHLLCEKDQDTFYHLKIPKAFFLENLANFFIFKGETIRLFLCANNKNMFLELRGKGGVNFGEWLQ